MSIPNFLSPIEFSLAIERLPETRFYVQSINIPGFNTTPASQATPFKALPFPSVKLEYDDLTVTVLADENLSAFREVSEWLVALTFPEAYSQYSALEQSRQNIISDMSLFIMDSNKNANIEVKFINVFPVSISSIQMNTRETDVVPPTFDVQFRFDSYTIV
jgi:hypothetical protein